MKITKKLKGFEKEISLFGMQTKYDYSSHYTIDEKAQSEFFFFSCVMNESHN